MSSLDNIAKFNAQTSGREKLVRLCQYITKFVNGCIHLYYTKYAKGGVNLLEFIYKLREFEQYFLSCRRLMSFGRCTDQLYSAVRCMQLCDPVLRMTLATSKFWQSLQMFGDHILWLIQMGLIKADKQIWTERTNKFWLYSVTLNLLRDFYELICLVQKQRTRSKDSLDSELARFSLGTPMKWAKKYPKLSCDLTKNFCDFWIPYTSVNKIPMHPTIISMLGIISTTMGILQVYHKDYRLQPA